MGGNALSVPGMRLDRAVYSLYEEIFCKMLQRHLPSGTRFSVVRSYNKKASFGDMDILVESHPEFDPVAIKTALVASEMFRNGDVTSYGINVMQNNLAGMFQVDIIKIAPEAFDFACKYFAFNDLGNLMGRIAHKQGFKYGHDGLWYVLRDPDDASCVVKEILVSRDHDAVVAFLGYDVSTWKTHWIKGFDDLEEIFKFVSSSPYFNKDIYLLQNRNHHARVRDKKRKTYMEFLEWCKDREFAYFFPWEADHEKKEFMRNYFLLDAFELWPEFKREVELALSKHTMRKAAKQKYNGARVSELTGLQGKELGAFMAEFKFPWFYDDHFWHWVYTVTQEDVDKAIMTAWERKRE